MNLFTKQKQTYTYQKKTCYQRENAGGEGQRGGWDEPTHNNYVRICKRKNICLCISESFCLHLRLMHQFKSTILE